MRIPFLPGKKNAMAVRQRFGGGSPKDKKLYLIYIVVFIKNIIFILIFLSNNYIYVYFKTED